jgi:hypothetical protein
MRSTGEGRSGVLQWVVVLVVGVLVVTLVLGLNLISRLDDGQKVLNTAQPAFVAQRVAGDRAGINIIGDDANMANPIVNAQGGAAAEVPKLIAFVSQKTGLSQAAVVAALAKNFPHVLALLQTIPLSAVTAEEPGLLAFLEKTLHLSEAQLLGALVKSFPALAEALVNLPTVTNGWDHIQNIGGLTLFNGTPVQSVPQLATYFSGDVIPVLQQQQGNFESLDGTSTVNWIAPLLLIIGLVVIVFALVMIALNLRGPLPRAVRIGSASVVAVVGVGVVVLVLALSLLPRLTHGQKLLDALAPLNTTARVHGDRAGITMVSAIADLENPIMNAQGGAAAEVPQLIAFVSKETKIPPSGVVALLQKNFPHTLALLQTLPLSSVSAEIPGLLAFLEKALKVTPTELVSALKTNFPAITQAIVNLTPVVNGWDNVPGTASFTNNSGAPVRTVPAVRSYFSDELIPVLETQRNNYWHLVSTSDINFLGPLVLIIGLIVIAYGLLMILLAWQVVDPRPKATAAAGAAPIPSPAS